MIFISALCVIVKKGSNWIVIYGNDRIRTTYNVESVEAVIDMKEANLYILR